MLVRPVVLRPCHGLCGVSDAVNRSFLGAGGDMCSPAVDSRGGVVGTAWLPAAEAA